MIVNKTTFAKLAGISRATATLGVQRGTLAGTADGYIDTEHPTNAAYLERKRDGVKPKKPPVTKPKPLAEKQAPKPPRERKSAPLPDPSADLPDDPPDLPDTPDTPEDENIGMLSIEKIKAEIKYKTEAAEAYRIKRLERLGLLVEREHVRQTLGRFNAELRIRLLEMPGTIAPRLVAMARSGSQEHEIAAALEDEIAKAIDHAKATVERSGLAQKADK